MAVLSPKYVIFMDYNMMSQNPLLKYVRQPGLYWEMPSHGQWWPPGSLEPNTTNELPVLPMNSRDEMLLKTPDALLNGSAIVELFHSCIPNIKNAWEMPSIDVDSALIAIRIASTGEFMPFESSCPKCNEDSDYDVDLRNVMGKIRCPHYLPFEFKKLTFQLKPQSYREMNVSSQMRFVEQSIQRALRDAEMSDEDRKQIVSEQIAKLEEFNCRLLTTSTEYIATPDESTVTDPDQIKEFYSSAESSILRRVKQELNDYAETGGIKPLDLKCNHCEFEYQRQLVFNYSDFFE
jgi:hypothetical protein